MKTRNFSEKLDKEMARQRYEDSEVKMRKLFFPILFGLFIAPVLAIWVFSKYMH